MDQSTTTLNGRSESHAFDCYAAEGGTEDSREKVNENSQGSGIINPPLLTKGTLPYGEEGCTEPDKDLSNESKNEPDNNKGKSRTELDPENGSDTEYTRAPSLEPQAPSPGSEAKAPAPQGWKGDQGESSETEEYLNPWEGSDAAEDMDDEYYHTLKDKQL